jgi:F0F1-type ATP synthase assembly protein I
LYLAGMEQKPSSANQSAMTLGYQLLSAMIVCVGGGYWLDVKRGGGHMWTLIGIGFAFVYGGYEVWKLVRQLNSEDAKEKSRDLTDNQQ